MISPSAPASPSLRDAVLVPIKDFSVAKGRLRGDTTLDVGALARDLATQVLRCAAPRPVYVASESASVSLFARENGARVLESRARGLNDAIQRAYRTLGADFERLIIAHADLRDPDGLGAFEPDEGITIVTDQHGRGTNVLVVPTRLSFQFHYGPLSRRRHEDEAARLGVTWRVIEDSPWRFDVDEPGDLSPPQH